MFCSDGYIQLAAKQPYLEGNTVVLVHGIVTKRSLEGHFRYFRHTKCMPDMPFDHGRSDVFSSCYTQTLYYLLCVLNPAGRTVQCVHVSPVQTHLLMTSYGPVEHKAKVTSKVQLHDR